MLEAYITRTGSFLPGEPIDNENLARYLGKVLGESRIKDKILKVNGIKTRHYALDSSQNVTHSSYELAAQAVKDCLKEQIVTLDYLSAGSTHTPLLAPGLSSLLHDELTKHKLVAGPLEINSNSGICSSGAQALVNATRAIKAGDAKAAVSVGVEQPSANFRSKVFRPPYDVFTMLKDIRSSKWFMSTFLRFMLSDGAGACLLEPQPSPDGISLKVDWTYSRSFANEAPLCMHLPSQSPLVLSQDVKILSKYMAPLSERVVGEALNKYNETLDSYTAVLPHMSSYYFERSVKKTIAKYAKREVPYWTNLQTAGNTGAASIYIMLDEYIKTKSVKAGDRLLLFVPESGQFNFVLISLTVV
ncbi:MAG: 3-oxoacyl-[acyl-carrier-protein] synthase III C-terminal domain-containing protein [Trueperaceae bacterium]